MLDQLEGQSDPQDAHFPEDWIGSTTVAANKGREDLVEEGLSRVVVAGESMTLRELFERFPLEMLGESHVAAFGCNTQVLLKFLDSAVRLHLQCHPTVAFARQHLNSGSGKTEAYVILGVREEVADPYIYMGFQRPPEPQVFKQMIEEQDIDAILNCFDKIPIKPGDVFFVPGGMPHAIGEGVFMIEIMEPTDYAVRIEFERGGYVLPEEARFMNQGIDFGLSVFNFATTSADEVREHYFCRPRPFAQQGRSVEHTLIDESQTPCFGVHRLHVHGCYTKTTDRFYLGIVTDGAGTVAVDDQRWPVRVGSKFMVPIQTRQVTFESGEGMEITLALPPQAE